MVRSVLGLSVLLLLACAASRPVLDAPTGPPTAGATPAEEPIPLLQLPLDTRPTRYRLELTIDPRQPRFSGTVEIEVTLDHPRQVLWLHGHGLEVSAASVSVGEEAVPARYQQVNDDGVAQLALPRPVGPGAVTLRLAWSGAFDPRVVGLYRVKEAEVDYAYSQFQILYARRAFPGFDEPRFKTPFEVTLVVPDGDVAVANTAAVSEAPAGLGLRRIRHAATRPLPTYLLAWAVGPFEVVEAAPVPPSAVRSWPVPLRGIAPRGRGGELGFGLDASRELLLLEEAYFGIPFPYPKLDAVAVPDFAWGAMENAGEIHYREDLLLVKEGVTAEERKQFIADTIAHEQAHQWFGDLVTLAWWDEAWLNESFATWMATKMVEAWRPGYHAATDLQKSFSWAMDNDALVTARAIRQPLKSMKDVDDQFDVLTYQKGGGVLTMFERYLGPEAFRQGVSRYLGAHADGSGSTDDLLEALARAAGQEVVPAFHTFLDQAGVPLVEASVRCGPKPVVTLQQSRYLPLGSTGTQDRLWQVPVCVRYAVGGKAEARCLVLREPRAALELPWCPAWLMPNAGGAGYYHWSMGGADLKNLTSAGYAQLDVSERISLARALGAAVHGGKLPIADALQALEPMAADPEGEVAVEAIPLLSFVREQVLGPRERTLVDAYAVQLYAPVFRRLGFTGRSGEGASTRRLRLRALGLLATVGHPEVVREAVRLGRAYAGLADGRFHPEVVDPDLAGLVLGAAVEHGDRAFFDGLRQRLATTDDGMLRLRILNALGNARDPERSRAALALCLDPALRKQEGMTELWRQGYDVRTRDATWRFIQEHFDALVEKVPPTHAAGLPFAAESGCDTGRADEIHAFFASRAGAHEGMAQSARQAEEAVRLCAAQASAQRESAVRFLTAHARGPVKAPPGR